MVWSFNKMGWEQGKTLLTAKESKQQITWPYDPGMG